MKKKKKIIIISLSVLLLLFGIKFVVHATIDNEKKAQKISEKISKKLELSDEQKAKVYEINLQMFKKMEEAKKDKQGKSRKEIRKELKTEWIVQIKEVLNEEQIKLLDGKCKN